VVWLIKVGEHIPVSRRLFASRAEPMTQCLSPLCDHVEEHQLFHRNLLSRVRDPALHHLCDVVVTVGGHPFACHKAVLCGASEFFRCLLTSSWAEGGKDSVQLSFLSADAFETLLDFIYTGRIAPRADAIMDVYAAARLLLMDALEELLRARMLLHISASSVFAVGSHAYMFDDGNVQEACENFIFEHFGAVSKTASFMQQPFECIVHFIASDRLFLPEGEAQVVAAVLRWVQHASAERLDSLPALLSHIRVAELSGDEVSSVRSLVEPDSPAFRVLARFLDDVDGERPRGGPVLEPVSPSAEEDTDAREPTRLVLEPTFHDLHSRTSRRLRDRHVSEEADGPRFRIRRRRVRNIRFDFVVPDFCKYARGAEALNSPWHKCGGGLLWRLEIYPRGPSPDQDEYLSVFLRCCDESSTDPFSSVVNFSLYVVEQNFGGQAAMFRATKTFTNEASCWGKAKYVRLEELMSTEQALRDVTTDSLVIGASITW
jgi:hypothetical protein